MVVTRRGRVVIIGRGEARCDTLTAFNHERVVRTNFARCPVCGASARCGHEATSRFDDSGGPGRGAPRRRTRPAELAVPERRRDRRPARKERRRLDSEIRPPRGFARARISITRRWRCTPAARAARDSQPRPARGWRRSSTDWTGLISAQQLFARGSRLAELTRRMTAGRHTASRLARAPPRAFDALIARRVAARARASSAGVQLGELGAGMGRRLSTLRGLDGGLAMVVRDDCAISAADAAKDKRGEKQ